MSDRAACSAAKCGCGLDVEAMPYERAAATAAMFKALGDPHRVAIVHLIAEAGEPVCVVDIERHLDVAQSTVSYHLKALVDVGILTRESRSRWSFYALRPERLAEVATILAAFASPAPAVP